MGPATVEGHVLISPLLSAATTRAAKGLGSLAVTLRHSNIANDTAFDTHRASASNHLPNVSITMYTLADWLVSDL